MRPVKELDELAVADRAGLVSHLDGLGVVGRPAADLAVSWRMFQRQSGCRPQNRDAAAPTRRVTKLLATGVTGNGRKLGQVLVVLGEEVLGSPLLKVEVNLLSKSQMSRDLRSNLRRRRQSPLKQQEMSWRVVRAMQHRLPPSPCCKFSLFLIAVGTVGCGGVLVAILDAEWAISMIRSSEAMGHDCAYRKTS